MVLAGVGSGVTPVAAGVDNSIVAGVHVVISRRLITLDNSGLVPAGVGSGVTLVAAGSSPAISGCSDIRCCVPEVDIVVCFVYFCSDTLFFGFGTTSLADGDSLFSGCEICAVVGLVLLVFLIFVRILLNLLSYYRLIELQWLGRGCEVSFDFFKHIWVEVLCWPGHTAVVILVIVLVLGVSVVEDRDVVLLSVSFILSSGLIGRERCEVNVICADIGGKVAVVIAVTGDVGADAERAARRFCAVFVVGKAAVRINIVLVVKVFASCAVAALHVFVLTNDF